MEMSEVLENVKPPVHPQQKIGGEGDSKWPFFPLTEAAGCFPN